MEKDRFELITPEKIQDNVFKLIGSNWMLITSGTICNFNTMTASWGGLGVLWGENVSFCFIRPSRFTYEFVEKNEIFTLSFLDERYKEALKYIGSHTGRKVDKVKATGLSPVEHDKGVYFNEARLVIFCKKIYYQDLEPENFLIPEIKNSYLEEDYHRMFVGKIIKCKLNNLNY
jgi:flavin reductase (DIM6/NTAB) family NADH-FMN oxidoreductase RutF